MVTTHTDARNNLHITQKNERRQTKDTDDRYVQTIMNKKVHLHWHIYMVSNIKWSFYITLVILDAICDTVQ